MCTDQALDALEQAPHERVVDARDTLVHHGARGSQYLTICYIQRLADACIEQSMGSVSHEGGLFQPVCIGQDLFAEFNHVLNIEPPAPYLVARIRH